RCRRHSALSAQPTAVIYTLSLHDALPIYFKQTFSQNATDRSFEIRQRLGRAKGTPAPTISDLISNERSNGKVSQLQSLSIINERSEEHTSELQSRENLVCRLLLEKKNIP